ncbi:hypothetical protein DOT_0631, partial [Desulfosporosinus sp. OT]
MGGNEVGGYGDNGENQSGKKTDHIHKLPVVFIQPGVIFDIADDPAGWFSYGIREADQYPPVQIIGCIGYF